MRKKQLIHMCSLRLVCQLRMQQTIRKWYKRLMEGKNRRKCKKVRLRLTTFGGNCLLKRVIAFISNQKKGTPCLAPHSIRRGFLYGNSHHFGVRKFSGRENIWKIGILHVPITSNLLLAIELIIHLESHGSEGSRNFHTRVGFWETRDFHIFTRA